jgi:hypothetical protein
LVEKSVLDLITAGFLASLAAGLATGLGALPALLVKKAPDRLLDAMLGFAGGVMIAASMFGLLVPSFRLGRRLDHDPGFLVGGRVPGHDEPGYPSLAPAPRIRRPIGRTTQNMALDTGHGDSQYSRRPCGRHKFRRRRPYGGTRNRDRDRITELTGRLGDSFPDDPRGI